MMTKREYTAIAVLALLLALSVWNLKSIDTLTGDIEISLSKSQSAAEKLDFKTARQRLDEGLELWLSADSYTHIFLRHPEIDSTADAFYELQQVLMQEDATACAAAYDKLRYHLDSIDGMEHLSFGSIL